MLDPAFKRDGNEMSFARLRNDTPVSDEFLRNRLALNRDDFNLCDRFRLVAFRTLNWRLVIVIRLAARRHPANLLSECLDDDKNLI